VAAAGDAVTHRTQVRADLPATAGLRSGMFARRRLAPVPAAKSVAAEEMRLVIPESALVRRGGLAGVFVVSEGRARLRWIAVGTPADGTVEVEVRAGLRDGERVVTDPSGLMDGAAVQEG
jgi:hypothetical protein